MGSEAAVRAGTREAMSPPGGASARSNGISERRNAAGALPLARARPGLTPKYFEDNGPGMPGVRPGSIVP